MLQCARQVASSSDRNQRKSTTLKLGKAAQSLFEQMEQIDCSWQYAANRNNNILRAQFVSSSGNDSHELTRNALQTMEPDT